MRRIALGFVAGAAFVLSSGLVTGLIPAHASISEAAIDAPADGSTTRTPIINVDVHAKSDGSGIARMRLDLSGPHFSSQKVWCAPTDASGNCASWQSGDKTDYSSTFHWDTRSLTTYNGEYTLQLTVVEVNNSSGSVQKTATVEVATPPSTPQWSSVSASTNGGPHVTLHWSGNPEPDISAYRINRPAQNGQAAESYTVDPSNPGAQNCSSGGGGFTCTDSQFSGGYAGDYTYYLTAVRYSPSDSGGTASDQSSRAATLNAPASTGNGNTSGGGSGDNGGTSSGGGPANGTQVLGAQYNNVGGPPQSLTPDPTLVNPNDFYSGTYNSKLPYGPRTGVGRTILANPQAASSFGGDDPRPLNARKLLLPIAGGLFTMIAALHFRRVLRDA